MIKFQHPDDKNQAILPKIIIIIGYFVVFMTAMVLPFDVANRNSDLNLSVDLLWLIALCVVVGFLILIVPFAFFWYENDGVGDDLPPDVRPGLMDSQFGAAFMYTLIFCAFIIVLSVILYLTPANKASIPIHYVVADLTDYGVLADMCTPGSPSPLDPSMDPVDQPASFIAITCNSQVPNSLGCSIAGVGFNWVISLSWLVYLFALLSFLGWWFFTIFAGVGLTTLPMDLINAFRTRPIPLPQSKFLSLSMQLAMRCDMILKQVSDMRDGSAEQVDHDAKSRRQRRKFGNKSIQLEQDYWELQRDWDLLKICRDFSNSNPLWYFLQLVLGVLTLALSLAWILHICLFILPGRGKEVSGFLNTLLIKLEGLGGGNFPMLGILFYIIFVFYLMWCVVIGNYNLGIRILFFKVYPMEVGKTQMNAFLVNLWVLLLCTIPLVHFTQIAFPFYSRFTSIQVLFGLQVRYLRFFTYFWRYNIFMYILLGVAGLALLVSLICPKDQTKMLYRKLDERAAQKNPTRVPSERAATRAASKK
jgi:LMBR1 domain-containing protein 1